MKSRAARLKLIAIIGLALGAVLLIGGVMVMSLTGLGVELLTLGVIVLGFSALLLSRSRRADDPTPDRASKPTEDERWYNPSNVYQRFLIYVGGSMLLIGGIAAIAFKTAANDELRSAAFQRAITGRILDGLGAGDLEHQWMWAALVVAILGALMIVAYLTTRVNGTVSVTSVQ
jgi:hypothetical protein